MPGPIKPTERKPRRAAPLLEPLETSAAGAATADVPDPAPYQSRRDLQLAVPGGVVTVTDTSWTLRGLRRWLRACPKVLVHLRLPTGLDPRDPEAPTSRPYYYDGYRFDVPYEQPTMIPAPIAEMVRQSQDPYPTAASRGLELYTITGRRPNGRPLEEGDGFDGGDYDDEDDEGSP